MISLSRFRGMLPVAACLAAFAVLANGLLLGFCGVAPRGYVLPEAYLDWMHFSRGADIAAALAAQKKPFLLYVGQSTAIEGIDPSAVADGNVAVIAGTGGSAYQVWQLLDPFFRAGLRPSKVVLCIHPVWLAGMIEELPPPSLDPVNAMRKAEWHEAGRRLSWWNWLARNRYYVNQVAFKALYTVRLKMGTTGSVDPWQAPERLGYPDRQTPVQFAAQMSYLASLGWFDRERYAHEREVQAKLLCDVIRRFEQRGTRVVVVLMPETGVFRRRVPPEEKGYLMDTLRRTFGTGEPPTFDFQDAISDQMFSDNLHMNDRGRAAFSRLLAEAIR